MKNNQEHTHTHKTYYKALSYKKFGLQMSKFAIKMKVTCWQLEEIRANEENLGNQKKSKTKQNKKVIKKFNYHERKMMRSYIIEYILILQMDWKWMSWNYGFCFMENLKN